MGTEIKTWQIIDGKLTSFDTDLKNEGRTEPYDLEPWLASNPEIIGTDIMLIGRQVSTKSGPIDLLGIDKSGNTVIIELKRSKLPRESLAQAIDYASNVAEWTVEKLSEICSAYTSKSFGDAFNEAFPEVDLDSLNLNSTQRIVLVGFSIEASLERMVEWLSDSYDVNVNAIVLSYVKTKGGDELLMKTSIISEEMEQERTRKQKKFEPLTEAEFMKKCAPELRPFFQEVLDQADKKGFSIYWATRSYSVRKYLPFLNRYASVIYCWLEGSFSFYFAQLPISNENAETLRRELLSYGIFRESGKKTLIATLNDETFDKANEVVEFILNKVNEIAKNSEEDPSQL
jgi:hypothetical protein